MSKARIEGADAGLKEPEDSSQGEVPGDLDALSELFSEQGARPSPLELARRHHEILHDIEEDFGFTPDIRYNQPWDTLQGEARSMLLEVAIRVLDELWPDG